MVFTGKDIAVCLLTYNHAHLIQSTLESVLNQSVQGAEIIISDDCSNDGTWPLLQQLARGHSTIRLIQTPSNLGMAGNANFAVRHTQRPYLALLHHDDLCRPDLLQRWAESLVRHEDIVFTFNAYKIFGSERVYRERIPDDGITGRDFLNKFLFPRWGCPVRGTAMIRRAAWEQVGGMREQFGLLADIDLWMRLSQVGSVGYIQEPLIEVRQERPASYPLEYQYSSWSWKRQRLLYEIHAQNRLAVQPLTTFTARLAWNWFRFRLSRETFKWLLYAIIKGKHAMLADLMKSEMRYEYSWVKRFRNMSFFIVKNAKSHLAAKV